MKLYVINTGHLISADPSAPLSCLPVMCFLIDTGNGYILFDTGCHPDAANGYWPQHHLKTFSLRMSEEEKLVNRLSLIGIKPEDIGTVVLSHCHLDHMGGVGYFTNAEVWAPKEDFEYAQTLVHLSTDVLTYGGYIRSELETPVRQYHLISEDCELVPGVDIVTLPGHTPGLLGLVVHLNSGTVILPQDSLDAEWNYLPETKSSGRSYCERDYFSSVEKIRALEKRYGARIFFGHDHDFYKNIRHLPEYYE